MQAHGHIAGPLAALVAVLGAIALTATPALAGEPAQGCPNEQSRAEQPFGLTLPDCRAYEMVSPPDTNGQDATDLVLAGSARAAVSGEAPAITYESNADFGDPLGSAGENQFLSRREPGSWSTQAIMPPHEPDKTESASSYLAAVFTPELNEGLAQTNAALAGAPVTKTEGGTREVGLFVADFAGGSYRYVADAHDIEPLGASTDLSHVVFGDEGAVSEWVDGRVVPVSVTNEVDGMSASVGNAALNLGPGEGIRKDVWHAVSADGSRVYFTSPAAEEEGAGQLYLRVNPEARQSKTGPGGECTEPALACTIEIPPGAASPGAARFWGASADGTGMFFTKAGDLYEYNLPAGQASGQTTALTSGGEVLGVAQISEDGSYVYFVADGALAAGAVKQQCRAETEAEQTGAEPKQGNLGCNLYVSHDGGEPMFIATLAAGDESDWGQAGRHEGEAGPEIDTAVVSPGGAYLAFTSAQELRTVNFPEGYDNEQAEAGECEGGGEGGRCREVYLYEAGSGGAGSLTCASCDPGGARPLGPASLNQRPQAFAEYRPRDLLEDGTLFFDSSDALVPQASDGREQRVRVRARADRTRSRTWPGGYESFFLDASASGEDVFFATADELLPQDTSNNVVVYDARVDGGFPATAAPPACENGDSCKPPPSPQPGVFGAGGQRDVRGPGEHRADGNSDGDAEAKDRRRSSGPKSSRRR